MEQEQSKLMEAMLETLQDIRQVLSEVHDSIEHHAPFTKDVIPPSFWSGTKCCKEAEYAKRCEHSFPKKIKEKENFPKCDVCGNVRWQMTQEY